MTLRVDLHISGSRCVIWRHGQHYIDVRRGPHYDTAECVRNGRVYRYVRINPSPAYAARQVISLIREELL